MSNELFFLMRNT